MNNYKITFSCPDWAIRKYAPVSPASEYKSKEFLNLPVGEICPFDSAKSASQLTIRQCPAISNYTNTGYIIPAWCDMRITFVDNQMNVVMSNVDYGYEIHSSPQIGEVVGDQFKPRLSLKLNSPWSIFTEEGYGVMWLPCFYQNKNYQALPAVVDTDLTVNRNPINLMFFEQKETLIKMGDPLVQVIPYKKENITAVSKSYSEQDHKRFTNLMNLNKLSRFGWRTFIKNKFKYLLERKDLEIDS
jgi:hypothetical protein